MTNSPYELIKKKLFKEIPVDLANKIPNKWEKTGDVLILRIPMELNDYEKKIAETYAKILDCKSVLKDVGGISGVFRKPKVKRIYGENKTETIHKENGIKYKLNPQKIMFSSGNMSERIRMANISNSDEIVIDLFTGIGYFTLPIAVYSKPKKIFACEINQTAFNYLCENIVLNHVTEIVEPILGDNRENAPVNIADRVIMGNIVNNINFLELGVTCLKKQKGFLHFHCVYPNKFLPEGLIDEISPIIKKQNREFNLLKYEKIKSFSPGMDHIVFDLEIW